MAEQKYLSLNDINIYKQSFNLSNQIWFIVKNWDYFSKDTIGKQFVRAVDSISANIAEGYGRYHKKDKIKFYRYSRGSIYESLDWLEKARVRKIINENNYNKVFKQLVNFPREINHLIKFTNTKLAI